MKIEELEKKLIEYKIAYYTGNPIASDAEYDILEDELRKLNPNSPVLKQIGTPVLQSEFKKVRHNIPMGSLDKVMSVEDSIDFLKKVGSIVISHKMDGGSLELIYESGKLIQASTRGDGDYGEDVTENAKMIRDIPQILVKPLNVTIRGEVYMKKSIFNILVKNGLDGKNPRNLGNGSIKQLDTKVTRDRNLSFLAFDCISDRPFKDEITKYSFLDFLKIPHVKPELIMSEKQLIDYIERMAKIRPSLDFEIDGLVMVANDMSVQKNLGYLHKTPRFGKAYKFPADEVQTTIEEIEWNVGQTGKVTPRIRIKSVDIGGTTVTFATGHNLKNIKKLGIVPGCKILIKRAGDVIPYITKVIDNGGAPVIPDVCPVCGQRLIEDETFLVCENIDCPEQKFRKIQTGIKALDIEEIGPGVLENFVNNGLIKDLSDIFTLDFHKVSSLERMGEKSANKILGNIKSKMEIPLAKFINALCINGIGTEASIEIAKKCKTLDSFLNIKSFNYHGFGPKKEKAILDGIQLNLPLINKIISINGIKVLDHEEKKISGKLNNFSFCFTGALNTMKRHEAEQMVKDYGGTISSVNKTLTYLVTNDTSSGSDKNEKARKFGTKIISEDDFLNMIK